MVIKKLISMVMICLFYNVVCYKNSLWNSSVINRKKFHGVFKEGTLKLILYKSLHHRCINNFLTYLLDEIKTASLFITHETYSKCIIEFNNCKEKEEIKK